MNEVFCGAFASKLGYMSQQNYAGDDYEVRFKPNMCFRRVLKDFVFHKHMGVSISLGTHNYPHLIRVVSDQSAKLLLVCQR